jgi:hypothetical protein
MTTRGVFHDHLHIDRMIFYALAKPAAGSLRPVFD